jgi:signal peptidase I
MFKKLIAWYRRPKSKTADFLESLIIILPLVFLIRTFGFGLYKVPTGSMETTMLTGEIFFADKFTPLFGALTHGDIITFNEPTYNYSQQPLVKWWQMYMWGPVNIAKRIIGVPGDHIKGVVENGVPVIYRNGKKLEEPYLNRYPLIWTAHPTHTRDRQLYQKTYDPALSLQAQPFYRITDDEVSIARMVMARIGEPSVRYPGTVNADIGNFGSREDKAFEEYDVQLGSDEYWVMGDNRQGSYDSRGWGVLKHELIHGKVVFRLWSHDDNDHAWMIVDLLRNPIDFWKRVRWGRCLNVMN